MVQYLTIAIRPVDTGSSRAATDELAIVANGEAGRLGALPGLTYTGAVAGLVSGLVDGNGNAASRQTGFRREQDQEFDGQEQSLCNGTPDSAVPLADDARLLAAAMRH